MLEQTISGRYLDRAKLEALCTQKWGVGGYIVNVRALMFVLYRNCYRLALAVFKSTRKKWILKVPEFLTEVCSVRVVEVARTGMSPTNF